jgi:hypothetical protein
VINGLKLPSVRVARRGRCPVVVRKLGSANNSHRNRAVEDLAADGIRGDVLIEGQESRVVHFEPKSLG